MDQSFFEKMHGGSTHFPIALIAASFLFDFLAYFFKTKTLELRAAAFYCLLLGTLGSIGAVFTGLIITNWETFGSGALLFHHYFVWPAFALSIGIATWRITVADKASPNSYQFYLFVCAIATVCMGLAGYWGGELLLGNGS